MGDDEGKQLNAAESKESEVPASRLVPVEYEETPILTPIEDKPDEDVMREKSGDESKPPDMSHHPEVPTRRSSSVIRKLGNIVFFVALFIVGVWLSTILRTRLPTFVDIGSMPVAPATDQKPGEARPTPDPFAGWRMQTVTSGVTKEAIPGVSFLLPVDVTTPECDAQCASQGMYLPGGTRFTVAARGKNQTLPFVRGGQLVDTTGKAFVTREATISGYLAHEYSGEFMGTTAGGFSFSKMRGVIIQLTEDFALELNHFTPSGSDADFAADDVLFDQVVSTVTYTGSVTPAPTF